MRWDEYDRTTREEMLNESPEEHAEMDLDDVDAMDREFQIRRENQERVWREIERARRARAALWMAMDILDEDQDRPALFETVYSLVNQAANRLADFSGQDPNREPGS